MRSPNSGHPQLSVEDSMNEFETSSRYMKRLTQAICRDESPSILQRAAGWNRFAYSIYVPRSVGPGAGTRPSAAQWKEASEQFWTLLAKLTPKRVVITGLDAWSKMPSTEVSFGDRCQAYRLGGRLIWCLAVPHPANRREGFRWREVSQAIAAFDGTDFPETI